MSDSIKISPKHGVNPTIPRCFFCGKEKNMVALLGRIPKHHATVSLIMNRVKNVNLK